MLDAGILAYYLAPSEVNQGCRGSLKVTSCDIHGEGGGGGGGGTVQRRCIDIPTLIPISTPH